MSKSRARPFYAVNNKPNMNSIKKGLFRVTEWIVRILGALAFAHTDTLYHWFNLHGGSLFVIFQGRNFHQCPFRVGSMYGLAVVS
jgi:uncharacterized membrane protein